jgi:type I restriction enzyme S subunit
MKTWRPSTWGDEISLQYGKALRGYEAAQGAVRVFGSNGPVGWTDKVLAKGPGVILGRKGAYRGVRYSEEDFFVIDTAYYVVPKTNLDMRWLYYAIHYHKLGEIDDGSPIPSTTRAAVYVRELQVPPSEVQQGIGRILGSIDNKIATNFRINQTLESIAQAIFKSWFVDFDPVKAKIAATQNGCDPLRAAISTISGKSDAELDSLSPEQYETLAATAALFPDDTEELEGREIPRGWTLAELSTMCELNTSSWNGKTLPTSVKYVDLANTKNGEIIEVKTMEGSNIPSRARRILEVGDTIVGTVRPGNRSFALVGEAGLTGSTGFAVLRPKKNYLREYIYLAATSDSNIERLAHLADGGAYPAVRPETVVCDMLPIPQDQLLRDFHGISSYMFDQILAIRVANRDLADLRDALLPKLLSGELTVEALTEPAMVI